MTSRTTTWPSTTTGFATARPTASIAASPGFTTAWKRSMPNMPRLLTEITEPSSSSARRSPLRPRVARSRTSAAIPGTLFASACRITGTMSPPGTATATPTSTEPGTTKSSPSMRDTMSGRSRAAMATARMTKSFTLGRLASGRATRRSARAAASAVVSTSRSRVKSGTEVASSIRRLMVRCRRVSGVRCPAGHAPASRGAGGGGGAGGEGLATGGAEGAGGALAPESSTPSTSAFTMRPPGPVPCTVARSMPSRAAMFRASGDAAGRPAVAETSVGVNALDIEDAVPSSAVGMPVAGSALSARTASISCVGASGISMTPVTPGSSAAGTTPAESPICAMGCPTSSVSPSAAMMRSTPESGASTVIVALSVSISTSGSPLATWSPSALSHESTVPSSMVSESLGMSMSLTGAPPVPGSP